MNISVCVCRFKRTETGDWENGLMVNKDKLIVDKNGEVVPAPIWDYNLRMNYGCVVFKMDEQA